VHLIDIQPTLADLASAEVPKTHPTRDLRPVSGVSLRPILENSSFERSQPIHFQFRKDMGLRDGDWKLVSFKGQEWELYNLANDRTEQFNLAARRFTLRKIGQVSSATTARDQIKPRVDQV